MEVVGRNAEEKFLRKQPGMGSRGAEMEGSTLTGGTIFYPLCLGGQERGVNIHKYWLSEKRIHESEYEICALPI